MNTPRYIRPELLEAIARNTLKKFDPKLITNTENPCVPIEEIIESLGLTIEYQYIRKNGQILGETVFDDSYIPLYNMEKRKYELVYMERGTIIIDAGLLNSSPDGRFRFTCAHELAHWLIHQELYCGTGNTAAMQENIAKSSDSDKYIERQADILASALLMPINQVKRCFYHTAESNKAEALAKQFGVSKQAMEIRLKEHHLL